MREETGGTMRPDGSMTVSEFWEKVFYPIVCRRLMRNSNKAYESAFRIDTGPALGRQKLQHVMKHGIEAMLGKMDKGEAPSGARSCWCTSCSTRGGEQRLDEESGAAYCAPAL